MVISLSIARSSAIVFLCQGHHKQFLRISNWGTNETKYLHLNDRMGSYLNLSHGPLNITGKTLIDENSNAMKELREIVLDQKWMRGLRFYTNFRHTGILESYHNCRWKYATKRVDLRYYFMFLVSKCNFLENCNKLRKF